MPQNRDVKILISIIDAANTLKYYHQLVQIARELLYQPDEKTLSRVEILLEQYLELSQEYYDEIDDCVEQFQSRRDSK